jgi:LytS/YehU family sensor histidine kinase
MTHARYYAPIYELASWLLIGGSAVFLYADRRAARKTEAHLQAAELDRIRRSKLALESRLQAMQARVEPQFLFNTLAQVERLYARDPVLGGRMLDDLIDYLRAAMPHMRDTSSTVAQEIDLARAYLDIVRIRSGDQVTFSIEVAPRVGDIRMPPMMLLPLLDRSIEHVLAPPPATGTIAIRAEVDGGWLWLKVSDRRADLAPHTRDDAIASFREHLTALHGTEASLDLRHTDAGDAEAILEIPLEPNLPDGSSGRAAIRQFARS